MTDPQKYAFANASGGFNSPSFPSMSVFAIHDQFVALGWVMFIATDPGQMAWLVQGYYTVGRDMVKGY